MHNIKRLRFYILVSIAVILVLTAVLGPIIAPANPNEIDLTHALSPPDREHLLGTDRMGRDLFSRLLYSARSSFAFTFMMVTLISFIGTVIGISAGSKGGVVDVISMQIADVLLAFPYMVFAIAIVGIWGPSVVHAVIALSLVSWAKYARLARGLVLDIRSKNYIAQALYGGSGACRIIFRYIMPMILPHIIIMTVLDIGEMMITLSTLSFLGLTGSLYNPDWGAMLAESRIFMMTYPHMLFFPGAALFITIVVFNLLGDSLRDKLDPKNETHV
jgi:ABC-type dipeptide/oligopeptide/nickel transport system permease subunit